mgnify:CR=1 FL=1
MPIEERSVAAIAPAAAKAFTVRIQENGKEIEVLIMSAQLDDPLPAILTEENDDILAGDKECVCVTR